MHPKPIPTLVLPTFAAFAVVLGVGLTLVYRRPPSAVPAIAIPLPTLVPSATPTPSPSPTPSLVPTSTPRPTPAASPTPPAVSGPPGTGVSTVTVKTDIGNFRATVMSLDGVRMLTDTASDSECTTDCPTLPLADYVTRNGGFAGVNGTYFCPADYSECSQKKNSFDFPVFNSRLHQWMSQGSLGWGGRSLFFHDGSGFQYRQDSTGYPGSPNGAIINYPGLINGGNVQIDDNQSGLSDKQKAKNTKVGIGTRNSSNVMVVVGYSVTMREFAYVFKALGATGALNLDSGGSAAVHYSGRYIVGPGRSLPNAVIFAR